MGEKAFGATSSICQAFLPTFQRNGKKPSLMRKGAKRIGSIKRIEYQGTIDTGGSAFLARRATIPAPP
jgi:hypothetical protein